MSSNITIVTAFFDIGRDSWTPENGHPQYLHRTVETYMERFARMAKLDNDMIIFTSEDLAQRIAEYRDGKPNTKVIIVDFIQQFENLRSVISDIQGTTDFQEMVNPSQIANPEYWSADYVLVNFLKSHFVTHSISNGLVDTELVSWIDFGYARETETIGKITEWKYDFDQSKIHVFSIKDWVDDRNIENVISNNDVYITGPHIVASKEMWHKLEHMMNVHMEMLVNHGMVDDDQTLLLMCTLSNPLLFEVHRISPCDWFVVFKDYNDTVA